MSQTFKEVPFIDGIREFTNASYNTQLIPKNVNSFTLIHPGNASTINFSGDTTYFTKQVYNENDLISIGNWMLKDDNVTIAIYPTSSTNPDTYTYITYQNISSTVKAGLFSVDYDKGIVYTSTGVKYLNVQYRYSTQYIVGQKMTQLPFSEYSLGNIGSLMPQPEQTISTIYQLVQDKNISMSQEYIQNGTLSIINKGDVYVV